jgi:hypothetical protein
LNACQACCSLPLAAADNGTAPTAPPPDSGSSSGKSSSSTGMVAGIAGGVAAALALAAGAAFVVLRRRRRQQQQVAQDKLLLADGRQPGAGPGGDKDGKGNPRGPPPPLFGVPLGSAYKGVLVPGAGHVWRGAPANGFVPVGRSGGWVRLSFQPRAAGAAVQLSLSPCAVPALLPTAAGPAAVAGQSTDVACLPSLLWCAEMGSQHSSPSKADSQAPLLRHPLHKFPSGVSGVSSHDNPMFDALSEPNGGDLGGAGDGSGSTQQSVLPQRAGSWDLHSQLVTQHAFNQAVAAAAAAEQQGALDEEGRAAAARAAANAATEAEGWRPDILAMMQQKAATGMGARCSEGGGAGAAAAVPLEGTHCLELACKFKPPFWPPCPPCSAHPDWRPRPAAAAAAPGHRRRRCRQQRQQQQWGGERGRGWCSKLWLRAS